MNERKWTEHELNWIWTDFIDMNIDFIDMNMNHWTELNWFYWHEYWFYWHEYEWTQLSWTEHESVQFSRSFVSDSLQPHEPEHSRSPWPSPTPGVYPNSCPLSQLYHLTISSSVVLFSSCLQPFPTSGSFQMSQLFASGGQNIGVSAWTSVLPMNIQTDFLQDGLVGSPCSPRDSQESSPTPQFKSINSSVLSFLYSLALTSIHDYWKNHSLD